MGLTYQQYEMIPAGTIINKQFAKNNAWATWATPLVPQDDTVPQISEMREMVSITYTPKVIGSKLLITGSVNFVANTAVHWTTHIFASTQTDSLGGQFGTTSVSGYAMPMTVTVEYTVTSLTPITFSARSGASSNQQSTNGLAGSRLYAGTLANTIIVEEIKQ